LKGAHGVFLVTSFQGAGSDELKRRPDEEPVFAGTDLIVARDGGIAAAYLFSDKLP
jgi:hypothetical protein